jgi:hypothetical protein
MVNKSKSYQVSRSYFYDKKTGQVYEIGTDLSFANDNVFGDIILETKGFYGDYYISEIAPESLEPIREYYRQEKELNGVKVANRELEKILQMNGDPNQVLVFYKLDFDK